MRTWQASLSLMLLLTIHCYAHEDKVEGAYIVPKEKKMPLELVTSRQGFEISNEVQKIAFRKDAKGQLILTTYVAKGSLWEPMFDAGRPLVEGSLFDLLPTEYKIVENSAERKAVLLQGAHKDPSYDWDVLVEDNADSPLIKFVVTCHLSSDLTISSPQPTVAFWMNQPAATLTVDQGPGSIYGKAGIPHCFGFPAAYLWHQGKEAVVFFNMTPMTWFSPQGVYRFFDVRVQTRSQGGQTGLGLHLKKISGNRIPAGDMITEYYLYSRSQATHPSKLEALDTMVRVCAPLHPATSQFPKNYLEGGEVSWAYFAKRAIEDLMQKDVTCTELNTTWNDVPLNLVDASNRMIIHAGTYVDKGTELGWDFSTTNNHLTPWILYTRLHPDADKQEFARLKKDALPRFYDPKANLIRHGTRQPAHVGDLAMSWQNFFFHLETLRTYEALAPEDFNPAIAGRFLMATSGLIEFAHNVNYIFPQWFDPYKKVPATQADVTKLGDVREPWQVGTYAYLMLSAYEITGDKKYLEEAKTSVDTLLTKMSYTVSNQVYTETYTDPADFPITELFGNSFGIAAAYKIYTITGDKRFLRYSRNFLNTLLRLTFWYEDESDPVSRDLRNLGLFYPHGGAHVATPWETVEAHLGIAWCLKHDTDNPVYDLLLKLSNLNRINSFYFHPAAYSAKVQALDPARRRDIGQYFPIEPFYCLEGNGGHRGRTAAYMASLPMWNYWMYEALAEADDHEVMVLNLDVLENFEEAISSAERHMIVFNPTEGTKNFSFVSKFLKPGNYTVTINESTGKVTRNTYTDSQMRKGIPLKLGSLDYLRLTLQHENSYAMKAGINKWKTAEDRLSYAYQLLQERARDGGIDRFVTGLKDNFLSAMQDYRNQQYTKATDKVEKVIKKLSERSRNS